ncbi:MAG TPA: peptide-methionine (R)-S-oxide reductase MsrB [Ohtaekwangia sp.]
MNRLIVVLLVGLCACNSSVKSQEKSTKPVKLLAVSDTAGTIHRTEAEWRAVLTPEQYHVLRMKGTDRPFTGSLTFTDDEGTYYCAACGNPLFTSDMKFKSECGWPSFDKELAGGRIKTEMDSSFGMIRTEIMCARCGSHLGHLFDDGPTLTGQRYCVNSTSLFFKKEEDGKKK